MGLDTTHDAWHGPYSSFARWREFIASKIGINLSEMDGFGGPKSWDNITDPLVHLLNHSDCDGEILPEHCQLISDRLYEIAKDIPDDGIDMRKEKTLRFAEGAAKAAKAKEKMEFG